MSDTVEEKRLCPCGAEAASSVQLSGDVQECNLGHQHQTTIEVPVCADHDAARLDGRLDGRMLLAAAKLNDAEVARIVMAHDPEPRLQVTHIRGEDNSKVVGYEIQPLVPPPADKKRGSE